MRRREQRQSQQTVGQGAGRWGAEEREPSLGPWGGISGHRGEKNPAEGSQKEEEAGHPALENGLCGQ